MTYKYIAISDVTLGGLVYISGDLLPKHYDYLSLIALGLVKREEVYQHIKGSDKPKIEKPVNVKIGKSKDGERKNKSKR